MTVLKTTLTGGLAALTVAGTLMGASAPASAWYRGGWGGPAAAGIIGGLAAGAIIGSATHPYYGYPPAYAYGPEPAYDDCYLARRPMYDNFGYFVGYRRVRVCN